jgi:hypothetical protein
MSKRPNGSGTITKGGYVSLQRAGEFQYEHIAIAERSMGKRLPAGAQVHHVDGNRANNAPGNLVVCPDQAYHRLLHRRTDALNACGNADYLICRFCGVYDARGSLKSAGSRTYAHPECRSLHRRSIYKEKRQHGKAV